MHLLHNTLFLLYVSSTPSPQTNKNKTCNKSAKTITRLKNCYRVQSLRNFMYFSITLTSKKHTLETSKEWTSFVNSYSTSARKLERNVFGCRWYIHT